MGVFPYSTKASTHSSTTISQLILRAVDRGVYRPCLTHCPKKKCSLVAMDTAVILLFVHSLKYRFVPLSGSMMP